MYSPYGSRSVQYFVPRAFTLDFFVGAHTMLSLSGTLGLLYLVYPWCVPIYSIFDLSIVSAIRNPVFLDVPMLSLLPRQLVKNRLGNKPTRYADFHEKTAELLLKLDRKPEHVIYSVGGKMKTTDCVRGYKSADCGLLFETESPYLLFIHHREL